MKKILLSSVLAVIFVGCGGGGNSTPKNKGYFEDSAVAGVDYSTSSGFSGTTGANGEFRYNINDKVTFKVGNIVLGSATLKADNEYVTPDNLDGVGVDNNKKALILQFLQSLDTDNNPNNGIQINAKEKAELKLIDPLELNHEDLTEEELLAYLDQAHETKKHIERDEHHLKVNKEEALNHFKKTKEHIEEEKAKHKDTDHDKNGNNNTDHDKDHDKNGNNDTDHDTNHDRDNR